MATPTVATIPDRVARWLALSDERDRYLARIAAAEAAAAGAYARGYADGQRDGIAECSLFNAQLHEDEAAEVRWREHNRKLSADRRNPELVAKLRARRAAGEFLHQADAVVLYFADHPECSFDDDPGLKPHGARQ
jgi:hypothetical protein